MKIHKLPDGSHYDCGSFDKAGRWYPKDEYLVPGAFNVRTPSRNYPYSYLKHFYTVKYARLLYEANEELYLRLVSEKMKRRILAR